jgi:hypothetical protein
VMAAARIAVRNFMPSSSTNAYYRASLHGHCMLVCNGW